MAPNPHRSILEKKMIAEDPEIVALLENENVRNFLWMLDTASNYYVKNRKEASELSNELCKTFRVNVKSAGPATRKFFKIIQIGLDEDDNPKMETGAKIMAKRTIKIVLSMANNKGV